MRGRQIVQTPCKINLHLGIHAEKDSRGYHRVDSVMVPVGLYNTITVEDAPQLIITHTPALDIAGEKTGFLAKSTSQPPVLEQKSTSQVAALLAALLATCFLQALLCSP